MKKTVPSVTAWRKVAIQAKKKETKRSGKEGREGKGREGREERWSLGRTIQDGEGVDDLRKGFFFFPSFRQDSSEWILR